VGAVIGGSSSLPKRLAYLRLQIEPASHVVPVKSAKHCQLAAFAGATPPLAYHSTGLSEHRRQHWNLHRPLLATITASAKSLCDRRHKSSLST
jgi:hypothetical protein